jgi:hypothetical protein
VIGPCPLGRPTPALSARTQPEPGPSGEPLRTGTLGRRDGRRDVSGGRGGRREFSLDEAGERAAIVRKGDDRDQRGRSDSGRRVTSGLGGDGLAPRRTLVVCGDLVSGQGMVGHGDLSQVSRDRVVRAQHPAAALQGVLAQRAGRLGLAQPGQGAGQGGRRP